MTGHLDLVQRLQPGIDMRSYFTEQVARSVPQIPRGYCFCYVLPYHSMQLFINTFKRNLAWKPIFSRLSLFWKNKIRLMRSHCCLCVCQCIPPIVARKRLGRSPLIVARQQLGKNPPIVARQRLGKNPPVVARQRLSRNITAVTNTHATIEELLDASFLMWPMSYQGKYACSFLDCGFLGCDI
jgi:hypothetical protein